MTFKWEGESDTVWGHCRAIRRRALKVASDSTPDSTLPQALNALTGGDNGATPAVAAAEGARVDRPATAAAAEGLPAAAAPAETMDIAQMMATRGPQGPANRTGALVRKLESDFNSESVHTAQRRDIGLAEQAKSEEEGKKAELWRSWLKRLASMIAPALAHGISKIQSVVSTLTSERDQDPADEEVESSYRP